MRKLVINTKLYNGTDTFNKYINEVSKIELNENEIIERILKGDDSARELLVTANLRFVISVAKQYMNFGVDLPTLISDGNLGLIIASQKFDPTTGFKFISYAVWHIRAKILQNLQLNSNIVKLPENKQGDLHRLRKKIELEEQQIFDDISYSMALDLFSDDKDILDLLYLSYGKRDSSLDQDLSKSGDESFSLLDTLTNVEDNIETVFDKLENKETVKNIINKLTGLEKVVIELYYGINTLACSKEYIAEKYDITIYKVDACLKNGLKNLKKILDEYNNINIPKIIKAKPVIFNDQMIIKKARKLIEKDNHKIKAEPKPKVESKVESKVEPKVEIKYTDVTRKQNIFNKTLTESEQNILDHLYGAFTGVKSTPGEVSRKLKISKLDIRDAVNKYKKIYG